VSCFVKKDGGVVLKTENVLDLRNASDDTSTSKDEEGSESRVGLDKGEDAGHDCDFLF